MPYYHMMDWFPFMGFGTVFSWFISLAVAYLVYKDAERRNMNGLLWGLPILIPWIGILFLILYLIMRDSGHRIVAQSSAPASSVPVNSAPARTAAEEVLDERYAKGEITREIYLQMKEDLKKQQIIEE
jgi:putative membrane protein